MTGKISVILLIVLAVFINTSCVSKKKYLELDSAKRKLDMKVVELNSVVDGKNSRIDKMIAEFEQMKNELMESNAIKNQYIDSLTGEVTRLAKTVNAKESAIGEKQYSFEFEKRQMTEDLAEQKQLLSNKQSELNQVSNDFQKLKDEMTQLSFDLNRERDEKQVLRENLTVRDAKIAELTAATDKLKSDIQSYKKQLSDKNEIITRLENNVKLLKKEIK